MEKAQEFCRMNSADLAVVNSNSERRFLQRALKENVRIILKRQPKLEMLLTICLQNLNCLRSRAIGIFTNEIRPSWDLWNFPQTCPLVPRVLVSPALCCCAEVVRQASGKSDVGRCQAWEVAGVRGRLEVGIRRCCSPRGTMKDVYQFLTQDLLFFYPILRALSAAGLGADGPDKTRLLCLSA